MYSASHAADHVVAAGIATVACPKQASAGHFNLLLSYTKWCLWLSAATFLCLECLVVLDSMAMAILSQRVYWMCTLVDRKRYLKPASVDLQGQHSSIYVFLWLCACLFVSVFELTRGYWKHMCIANIYSCHVFRHKERLAWPNTHLIRSRMQEKRGRRH